MTEYWCEASDGDRTLYQMHRRHYSCKNKKPKVKLSVGPGQKMVLVGFFCQAVFAWRKFIDDSGEVGVCCTIFRNESVHKSSLMILEAEQWAWLRWPGERLYTWVDGSKVKSTNPGYCFKMAGWKFVRKDDAGKFLFEKLATGNVSS